MFYLHFFCARCLWLIIAISTVIIILYGSLPFAVRDVSSRKKKENERELNILNENIFRHYKITSSTGRASCPISRFFFMPACEKIYLSKDCWIEWSRYDNYFATKFGRLVILREKNWISRLLKYTLCVLQRRSERNWTTVDKW